MEFQTVSKMFSRSFQMPALQITTTKNMGQYLWDKYGSDEGKTRFREAPCLK